MTRSKWVIILHMASTVAEYLLGGGGVRARHVDSMRCRAPLQSDTIRMRSLCESAPVLVSIELRYMRMAYSSTCTMSHEPGVVPPHRPFEISLSCLCCLSSGLSWVGMFSWTGPWYIPYDVSVSLSAVAGASEPSTAAALVKLCMLSSVITTQRESHAYALPCSVRLECSSSSICVGLPVRDSMRSALC